MAVITVPYADLVVYNIGPPTGDHKFTSTNQHTRVACISANVNGTYADADGVSFDAVAAIQASTRNGRTPVIRGAMSAGAGVRSESDTVVFADSVAVASPNVTFTLVGDDRTTAVADGAIAKMDEPVEIVVVYDES